MFFYVGANVGYREFVPVVSAPADADIPALRAKAIEQMKAHTRQYVLRQFSWINHKLIPLCNQTKTPIYILDTTDPSKWSDRVLSPALCVARNFLLGETMPAPIDIFDRAGELLHPIRSTSKPDIWKHWVCEICADKESGEPYVVVGGEQEWNQHLVSRRHKAREKGRRKRMKFEEWKARQALKEEERTKGEYGKISGIA